MLGYEMIRLRERCYELWLQNVRYESPSYDMCGNREDKQNQEESSLTFDKSSPSIECL